MCWVNGFFRYYLVYHWTLSSCICQRYVILYYSLRGEGILFIDSPLFEQKSIYRKNFSVTLAMMFIIALHYWRYWYFELLAFASFSSIIWFGVLFTSSYMLLYCPILICVPWRNCTRVEMWRKKTCCCFLYPPWAGANNW